MVRELLSGSCVPGQKQDRAWLVLGALLLVPLWIYKAGDLALPYFWDELGVYGRAAVYMHDHRLSLLPSALPPELSRGHPLLLPFLFAAAFRAFGPTPMVAHVGMLIVASGLALSVLWVGRWHWNAAVGLGAMALLLAQPLFLAQSSLLLPEIPMALAGLWAVHAFSRGNHGVAGLWLGLAIFLKETAVVLDVVLAGALGLAWLRARPTRARAVRGLLSVVLPVAAYGGFLLLQRHQNGWFLYPFHSRQIDFHWSAMKATLASAASFVFVEQGRIGCSAVLALGSIGQLIGRRPARSSARGPGLRGILAVFMAAFLLFSAGNVFMKRYLLCLLPPLAILTSQALDDLVRAQARELAAASLALALLCLADLRSSTFNCAYDMSFRDAIRVQQEATQYLESMVGSERPILANFPTVFGLEDPRLGYASKPFRHASDAYVPEDEYIFAGELYGAYRPPQGVGTRLVRRFASPYMTIALYRIVR